MHADKPDSPDDSPVDFSPDESPVESSESGETAEAESPPTDKPAVTEGDKASEEQGTTRLDLNKFWAFLKSKMNSAQTWANKVMAGMKGNPKQTGEDSGSFDQGKVPT